MHMPPPLSAMEACRSVLSLQAAPDDMPDENLRLRQALRWCLHNEPNSPAVQILIRAAVDELPPGSRIDPPGLDEYLRLVRLLRALPWVRRGFIRLGRDSDEWQTAAEVLCAQACLPMPQPGEAL
jgi:hypothetical protein